MSKRVHVVRAGECLSTIAKRYGFRDYKTLYDHADNAELKKKRPDPNLIHPGDEVVVPDLEPRSEKIATGSAHRFVARAQKRVLRVKLLADDGKPLAGAAYTLRFGNVERPGQTDGDGLLVEDLPMNVASAEVETDESVWRLAIGHLNPMDDTPDGGVSGAQTRLKNLGYVVGPDDGRLGGRTRAAIQAFQEANGLAVHGQLDAATKKKLVEVHGS